jgi:DNA-binding NarL/FixJ family response regulator
MGKIRVFLADDHALFREGIRALLSGCEDIEVVGQAADGREVLLWQAAAQFRLMTGRELPLEVAFRSLGLTPGSGA